MDLSFSISTKSSKINKHKSVDLVSGNLIVNLSAGEFKSLKSEDQIEVGKFYWHDVRCKRVEIDLGTIHVGFPRRDNPPNFTIQAFIPHYNESEIAHRSINHFVKQGIAVMVIDDGSNAFHRNALLSAWQSQELVTFIFQEDIGYYNWSRTLSLIDQLASESKAGWIIRCDSDEEIRTPNGSSDLTTYLQLVDSLGYNIIDTTGVNLKSCWGDLANSHDSTHYQYHRPSSWRTVRAWKNYNIPVNLINSGGHSVDFMSEKVPNLFFPFNLTLLHMPLRNENQTRQKIEDRISRGERERLEKGWHTHLNVNSVFEYKPSSKDKSMDNHFWKETLFERLTRYGIKPSIVSEDV